MRIVTIFLLSAFATAAAFSQTDRAERLRQATRAGDPKTVNETLDAGAQVDARDGRGQTALLLAVEAGHTEIARILLARGADVNAQAANQDTPWLLAGASGRAEILELMLTRGPDYSIRNRFGGDALIPACERGHVETVRLLTTRSKINVNHVNNLGWTCLLEAVILGDGGVRHQAVVRLVLSAGALPEIGDKDGVTALQHARRRRQVEVTRLLEGAARPR